MITDDLICSVARNKRIMMATIFKSNSQLRSTTMTMPKRILQSAVLLLLLLLSVPRAVLARNKRKHGNPLARSVRVLNESGVKIDLFWIHPETRKLAESHSSGEGVMYGAETGISSYVGHTFEVQEMPGRFGKCLHKLCRKAYFTVNRNEEQWITINQEFAVSIEDSATRAQERVQKTVGECKALDTSDLTPQQKIDAIAECLQRGIEKELNATDEEIEFQANVRKQMGEQLKHYTCQDVPLAPDVKTTPAVQNTTWADHDVRVLFESEFSSVRLVEKFLSDAECQSLLSQNKLSSGEVTPETLGVPKIVEKLKRMMTGSMKLPVDHYTTSNKPDLRVMVESSSNECEVQADGSCLETASGSSTGDLPLSRIVTTDDETVVARIYLQCFSDDASGGLMFFPKTGVRIQPVSGNAVLIVYRDLDLARREEDPFVDEHLSCPVTQGRAVTLEEVYYRQN